MVLPERDSEALALLRAINGLTAGRACLDLRATVERRYDVELGLSLWQHRVCVAGAVLAEASTQLGHAVDVRALDLLERKPESPDTTAPSAVSASGHSRLLPACDGWVAVTLNRPSDWDLLPALIGVDTAEWAAVASAVRRVRVADFCNRAGELGLAVATLPEGGAPRDVQWLLRRRYGPWVFTRPAQPGAARRVRRVVDLSALWAGPLCASILRRAGADVVTVESTRRPDTTRDSDPTFYRRLHDGHAHVALDFTDPAGREELRQLILAADVVISAARPRALEQLGLDPFAMAACRPGLTWVAITAYGLTGPWRNRVGYGDDTAVAGGLVTHGPTPMFCGDAVADPITGLYAAIAALAVSAAGGGVIDAALRDGAAHVARPMSPAPS